jgi:DNA polymerase III psi subunit
VKIATSIDVGWQDVEVEVSPDDLINMLTEKPECKGEALKLINAAAQVFSAVSPEIIAELSEGQRKTVRDWLLKTSEALAKQAEALTS